MAPPANHGALSREADLRTMSYVMRFIDNNRGTYMDWNAQEPVLTSLARKYDLRPHWKGYENPQYVASALHAKIVSWLNTRKTTEWKIKECKGEASVDKLFEIGSSMLEQKVRDELNAAIQGLPFTSVPKSESNSQNEITAEADRASKDPHDKTYRATGGSSKSRSTHKSSKPKLPESRSRPAVNHGEEEDEEEENIEHDEADELDKDAADRATTTSGPRSRSSRTARTKARRLRKLSSITTDEEEDDEEEDDEEEDDEEEFVAFVPQQRRKTTRANAQKPAPKFPNLPIPSKTATTLPNIPDSTRFTSPVSSIPKSQGITDSESEGEDEDVAMSDEDDEVLVVDDEGTFSKKRKVQSNSEQSALGRKRSKVSRDAPAGTRDPRFRGRKIMQDEASSPADVYATELELEDGDEDINLARQVQKEDYSRRSSDIERDHHADASEANLDVDDVGGQHSSPPAFISRSNRSDDDGLHGLQSRDTNSVMISTPGMRSSHSQDHLPAERDIMQLDVRQVMLEVDNCLDRALLVAFPEDGDVKIANLATEPSRSLAHLYVRTLGSEWLNIAQMAMNEAETAPRFNASAMLKALIWHYLEAEVLSKDVLSDTVYSLLGKIRTHLEPVLDDVALPYSSAVRRASQAQLKDPDFKDDLTHAAHEVKAKLMMVLSPHLNEVIINGIATNWRKVLSKSLLEVCHLALLLRAKLEMQDDKHETFVFNSSGTFEEKQMDAEGAKEGRVLFTKMPGVKKFTLKDKSGEVVVKAMVVMFLREMDG